MRSRSEPGLQPGPLPGVASGGAADSDAVSPRRMLLSVVIAVRDRRAELARCLAALAPSAVLSPSAAPESSLGAAVPFAFEVVVVDNGSRKPLPAPLPPGVRVLTLPEGNRCTARNAGAEAAQGEWIAFTDSDCVPDPGWLAALAAGIHAAAATPEVFALAGEIVDALPTNSVEAYIARRRWIDNRKFLAPGRRFSPPFAATANLAVRRADYLRLGGLDPALAVAGEDADLCWRAAAERLRVEFCPAAVVTHHHRATLRALWRQAFAYGYGNAELFARWRGRWGARRWVEPCHAVWALKGLLKWPLRLATARTPLDRHEPLYDAVANTATLAGRLRAALRHRVFVI